MSATHSDLVQPVLECVKLPPQGLDVLKRNLNSPVIHTTEGVHFQLLFSRVGCLRLAMSSLFAWTTKFAHLSRVEKIDIVLPDLA